MNVSLTESLENYVREKVAIGEYQTASEVISEALRLLRHYDKDNKVDVRRKITQGMDSIRVGRTIPSLKVKADMVAFKKNWKQSHGST